MNELVVDFRAWLALRFLVGVTLTGTYTASMTMLVNFLPARCAGCCCR